MDLGEFSERHLFYPMGIYMEGWHRSRLGVVNCQGGLYLRPRDMAKIGQMYLDGGVWDGARILDEAWIGEHFTAAWEPCPAPDLLIAQALLREAKDRADFAGAKTSAMSIAALRTTVEETVDHRDGPLDVVRGRLLDSGKQAAFYPGKLPDDPAHLLTPARKGAETWLDADYSVMNFAPAPLTRKPGDGLPHIRLDKAAQFLLGDQL